MRNLLYSLSIFFVNFVFVVSIAFLDSIIIRERVMFSVVYLVPIGITTWYAGKIPGFVISMLSILAWFASATLHEKNSFSDASSGIMALDAILKGSLYLAFTTLLSALKTSLLREKALSRTDFLTGLSNIRAFYEGWGQALYQHRKTGGFVTLVYIDVDNFKAVNDANEGSHKAGDAALKAVANAIRHGVQTNDIVARIGGDEFAVIMMNSEPSRVRLMFEKVQGQVNEKALQAGWPISLSIGIVTHAFPPPDVEQVVHHADRLMFNVKSKTGGAINHEILH